jgi:glycosyltransferase involved in cell wall biosynthesis
MKVLIVNETDTKGGAARAAYRLHKSLLVAGIQSNMLVQRKFSDDPTILEPDTSFRRALAQLRPRLDYLPVRKYRRGIKSLFSPSWLPFSGMAEQINNLNLDIVHLHWIAGGMMRIEELTKIMAPIIWSLHDNWAFTGGCHIMGDCSKHMLGCGCCPVLGSENPKDLSWKVSRKKQSTYRSMEKFTVVGVSRWIAGEAKKSRLLADQRILCLPNPIDTDDFRPIEKTQSRELLGLPTDRKILAFGAIDALSDLNKGFHILLRGLDHLKRDDLELVVFGASHPSELPSLPCKIRFLGRLHDDVSLCLLYSACDVLIVPSLQENLSNAIMESLACGTPVVAFNVGGNADMIEHKKNGYLARPFEPKDLALGVKWVLDASNYENLRMNAREKVLQEFRSDLVARSYIKIYNEILQGGK